MAGLEILQSYNAFFSGELQAQEDARSTLRTATGQAFGEEARNRIREALTAHATERSWWSDAAGVIFTLPGCHDETSILDAHAAAERAILDALERKQANPANATGSYHNQGNLRGRIMNPGSLRSFSERSELSSSGPAVFCDTDYVYLRRILPGSQLPPALMRPPCLDAPTM